MDDQTRMLASMGGLGGLSQADVGDPDSVRKQQSLGQPQQDIGDILQQIMAITDESLDEAQARLRAVTCDLLKGHLEQPIPDKSCLLMRDRMCTDALCWPEEAPAQWSPQREGELGGSTAGCALPLNFQHRSVQERMSTPPPPPLLPHHPLHADDKEKNTLQLF
ncbi:hypothetical protein DNTS_022915 [Danionella cerebrum]|uniref:PBC domain-containing protein n=1 Tax=Danionella cerebrum TaxID=2873325 RepID=A0A553REW5_9TELE|nr:hypothetical protein DNTS_022915 [Danionella translucida]